MLQKICLENKNSKFYFYTFFCSKMCDVNNFNTNNPNNNFYNDTNFDQFMMGGKPDKKSCDQGMSMFNVRSEKCLPTTCVKSNKQRLVNGKCPKISSASASKRKKRRSRKSKRSKKNSTSLKTLSSAFNKQKRSKKSKKVKR